MEKLFLSPRFSCVILHTKRKKQKMKFGKTVLMTTFVILFISRDAMETLFLRVCVYFLSVQTLFSTILAVFTFSDSSYTCNRLLTHTSRSSNVNVVVPESKEKRKIILRITTTNRREKKK
jgi:hypothetical protein